MPRWEGGTTGGMPQGGPHRPRACNAARWGLGYPGTGPQSDPGIAHPDGEVITTGGGVGEVTCVSASLEGEGGVDGG